MEYWTPASATDTAGDDTERGAIGNNASEQTILHGLDVPTAKTEKPEVLH